MAISAKNAKCCPYAELQQAKPMDCLTVEWLSFSTYFPLAGCCDGDCVTNVQRSAHDYFVQITLAFVGSKYLKKLQHLMVGKLHLNHSFQLLAAGHLVFRSRRRYILWYWKTILRVLRSTKKSHVEAGGKDARLKSYADCPYVRLTVSNENYACPYHNMVSQEYIPIRFCNYVYRTCTSGSCSYRLPHTYWR